MDINKLRINERTSVPLELVGNPLKQATRILSILSTAVLSSEQRILSNLHQRKFPTTDEGRSQRLRDKIKILFVCLFV